jgi:hypothetical protein
MLHIILLIILIFLIEVSQVIKTPQRLRVGDHWSGMRGSSYQPFASDQNAPKGQKQSAQGIALG